MNATWTRTIPHISAGLFATAVMVAGSGTFVVTGSGAADSVVTDQPGKTLYLGAQHLPFSRGFSAQADAGLLQIHVTSHGPASCKIVFGGRVVASNSGAFGADCVYQAG